VSRQNFRTIASAIVLSGVTLIATRGAHAESDTELLRVVKSLESRISALEAENKKIKRETVQLSQATNQPSLRETKPSVRDPSLKDPSQSYASLETKAVKRLDQPNWSSVYVGASFGAGVTRSHIHSDETFNLISLAPPSVQGQVRSNDGGHPTGYGATADLYLGYNAQIASNVVAGVQIEGSMADLNFSGNGSLFARTFDGSGFTGQTSTGGFRPSVHARWMASALARGGVLATPETLLYGVAGWTVAGFEYHDLTDNSFYQHPDSFVANGPTVGAGLEQKLSANWSVRTEYRYTQFLPVNVDSVFNWSAPGAATQSDTIHARFENSMHTLRIGAAYTIPVN
jgi:opacity protein-like surface antigen